MQWEPKMWPQGRMEGVSDFVSVSVDAVGLMGVGERGSLQIVQWVDSCSVVAISSK